MSKRLTRSIIVALAAIFVTLLIDHFQLLERFENRLWDLRVTYLAKVSEHNPSIKLILIDQNSLDWAQANSSLSWPWPREMYTAMIDYCRAGGAKVIAVDMLFSEPSVYGVEDDKRFANSLSHVTSIGALVVSKNNIVIPIKPLVDAFDSIGFVSIMPDEDGIIRRTQLWTMYNGNKIPNLALAMYMSSHKDHKSLQHINHKKVIINYHGSTNTYDTISASAVIESKLLHQSGQKPSISPEFFKDSYVIIGASASGLMDQRTTPVQNIVPGAEIHATVLDNLLSDAFVTHTPFWITVILLCSLVLTITYAIGKYTSIVALLFYFFIGIFLSITAGVFSYYQHSWLEISVLIAGVIVATFGSFSVNYIVEGQQRRFIKNAFSRYLSPKIIDSLIAHPENLKLGGRRETLTILFSDIEGFTSICSHLQPEEIASFLNDYLGLMSDTIMEFGGTIDKFEGDAIIAFWNAPIQQKDHALLAVQAALECQKLLKIHSERFLNQYGYEPRTRFGIHTGEVVIGNLGTHRRFDYTFIGDAGNLASRLESANKQFGSFVMISEITKNSIGDYYYYRNLGNVNFVGSNTALNVFEPLEYSLYEKSSAILDQFANAIDCLYNGDLLSAEIRFRSLVELDNIAKTYVDILEKIKKGEIVYKNGILFLSEK
jgi:adenylate cyclase